MCSGGQGNRACKSAGTRSRRAILTLFYRCPAAITARKSKPNFEWFRFQRFGTRFAQCKMGGCLPWMPAVISLALVRVLRTGLLHWRKFFANRLTLTPKNQLQRTVVGIGPRGLVSDETNPTFLEQRQRQRLGSSPASETR